MTSERPPASLLPKDLPDPGSAVGGVAAVGLTGGLASGKSTALAMFAELGARTISADTLVHALYERADVKPLLRERFGDGIFDADGDTDRRALASLVADDENGLGALEALVHPHIMRELSEFVTEGPPGSVNVCEVPLLFEGGLQGIFDLVVTIEAPLELRRERASGRLAPEVFDCLDARLAGEEARSSASDVTYVNTGSLADLAAFVARTFEQARLLSTDRTGRFVRDV